MCLFFRVCYAYTYAYQCMNWKVCEYHLKVLSNLRKYFSLRWWLQPELTNISLEYKLKLSFWCHEQTKKCQNRKGSSSRTVAPTSPKTVMHHCIHSGIAGILRCNIALLFNILLTAKTVILNDLNYDNVFLGPYSLPNCINASVSGWCCLCSFASNCSATMVQ